MNRKRMMVLLAAGALTLASMNMTMVMADDTEAATEVSTENSTERRKPAVRSRRSLKTSYTLLVYNRAFHCLVSHS